MVRAAEPEHSVLVHSTAVKSQAEWLTCDISVRNTLPAIKSLAAR
jgi:hypothetical protein